MEPMFCWELPHNWEIKTGWKKYLIKVFTKIIDQGFRIYCCLAFAMKRFVQKCLGRLSSHPFFHTDDLDTIFIQIYMDAPPGVPGVSKKKWQKKMLSSCAKIALKRHKLQKIVKIEKKMSKNPVFLDFFKYSSTWGQFWAHQTSCGMFSGSWDPGGAPIVEIQEF